MDSGCSSGTTLDVVVSNDNGSTWLDAFNNQETSFSTEAAGNTLRYAVFFSSSNSDVTPSIDQFVLEYEEGYPDRPMLDVAVMERTTGSPISSSMNPPWWQRRLACW